MKKLLGPLYEEVFAYKGVCEVRLALMQPIAVCTADRRYTLSHVAERKMLEDMLSICCDHSLYTAASKMVQGYIPYRHGVRVGVAGLYTLCDGRLHSLSQVSGLVIRIGHVIEGCSRVLPDHALGQSVLVVSPPFGGKTTFLRDLATRLSPSRNVVLLDERDELAGGHTLPVGNCMVVRGSPKDMVYSGVVRALTPQYVVCDELCGDCDIAAIAQLKRSGMGVAASYHAADVRDVPHPLVAMFDVVVTLSPSPRAGTIVGVRYA